MLLADRAARAVLRQPGPCLVADRDRQRACARLRTLRGESAPGTVAADIVHGHGTQQTFFEGVGLDVVTTAVELCRDVEAKAGEAGKGDLVADVDLPWACLGLSGGRRWCGEERDKGN